MKANRKEQYVAPEVSSVEIQNEGVICSSVKVDSPYSGEEQEW